MVNQIQMLLSSVPPIEEETGGRIFGLDPQLIFDAVVLAFNIFLLFILLSYLLFNPVKQMLQKRHEKIAGDIETANLNKEEAIALKEQYEVKLKKADKEVEAIMSEARKKALKNEERIVAEAKEEASRIIKQAQKEAELEKKKAADDIKNQIIMVSTMMASKIVASSIDAAAQDELIDDTLKEIGDKTWLS